MALKRLCSILVLSVAAGGCSRSAVPAAAPEEPDPLSVTRWTDKTELFAEYPPLVVGGTSRFAIHLTRLDSFKALTEGNVEVRLQGGSGQPEVFRVDAPSRPGIFGVDVKPAQAGKRELVIVLKAKGLSDEHRVGEVDVFGQYNYLEVWNHERFVAKLQREPFTDDDARALSDLGL